MTDDGCWCESLGILAAGSGSVVIGDHAVVE